MANTKLPARLLDTSAIPALNVTGDLTVNTTTLKVDSTNDRVGVGIASPGRTLHIKDSGQIKLENTSTNGWAGLDIHTSVGTNDYDMYMGMLDGNGRFFIDVDSNGEDLTILQNGNVGIGETSPGKTLDVEGAIRAKNSGGSAAAELDITSGATWRFRSNPTSGTNNYGLDIIKGGAGTDIKMSIDSNGNVGIGTSNPTTTLHIEGNTNSYSTSPLLYFGSTSTANANVRDWAIGPADSNYGDFHIFQGLSTGASAIGANQVKFTINAAGQVGIGQRTPTGQLHVYSGDAGSVSPSSQADDLVVENGAEVGITLMSPDDQSARIRFTSPSTNSGDEGGADIFYRQNINKMSMGTVVSGGKLAFKSGAGTETMVLDGGQVGIGTSPGSPLTVKPLGSISDGHNIVDFVGSDSNQRLIVANFACGSDEDRVGFIWENQGVALWRNWMDDDGHLRLKSSNPTHDHDGKRVVTETMVTGTSGGFLEQIRVYPGNVANYTGDIEGGVNKGGTQIWIFTIQGNNTWYKVLTNMHDMSFEFWTVVGDAGSRDQASYSCNLTSPAYGVSSINQNYYHNGGWNTGSFNYRFVNTPGNTSQYDLECQFSSYYSSSNNATGYIYLRRVY